MKTYTYIASILILLPFFSCNTTDNINETYHESIDSLYIKCAELKGFGPFIIGHTTFSEAASNTNVFKYGGFNSFSKDSEWGTNDNLTEELLLSDSSIKQIYTTLPFQIGEMEFKNISLAFYNDILVAIVFEPQNRDLILDYYISKYGNGNGYKLVNNTYTRKGYYKSQFHSEKHEWENEKLKFTFSYLFMFDKNTAILNKEFLIIDKTGLYDKFIQTINDVQLNSKSLNQERLIESLEQL